MGYSGLGIFQDITDSEVEAMVQCFRMRRARFGPGNTICAYGTGGTEVGVVLHGAAELVRFDYAGTRTILERMEAGGVFGEALSFTDSVGDGLEVVSAGNSEVLFMEYARLMGRCENACAHHSTLVRNMFRLVTEQTRQLSRRVEVLSRRSIREKLLCCFRFYRQDEGAETFVLPFTFSALADYISTDRSAMMRELKKLKEEGIVSVDGRRVTLLESGRA